MNVHHLELFYYVARHGGISSAVRHMPYGIQQPAVSSQVLQLEKTLRDTHLADTIAGIAGDGLVALGGTAAAAGVALHQLGDVNFHRVAEHGLTEFDLQFVLEIGAAKHL